jgi:hypothetical protein
VFTDSLDTGGGLFLDLEILSKKGAGGTGEEEGGKLNIGTPGTCPPLYALTLIKKAYKNIILPFPTVSQGLSNPFLSELFYYSLFTSLLHIHSLKCVLAIFFSLTMLFVHCFSYPQCTIDNDITCTLSNLIYSIPETFVPGLSNFEDARILISF